MPRVSQGRTNVFMNGLDGPGPMGFQPPAFDFAAGDLTSPALAAPAHRAVGWAGAGWPHRASPCPPTAYYSDPSPSRSSLSPLSALPAAGTRDPPRRHERLATRGDTIEPNPDDEAGGSRPAVTVVGEGIMFDTAELSVGVDQELEITFDNRADGIQHNMHVRGTASDEMSEITQGRGTQTLTVSFDEPSEYEYLSATSTSPA